MQKNTKIGFVIFLGIQILIVNILKAFPEFVEHYYSNGIYVYISKLLRYTFGWLPFSFGDIAYTFGIIFIVKWFVTNRHRIYRDTINWLVDIIAVVSMIYLAFHMFWGFNYYRQPLNTSLGLKADYSTEELISITKQLIQKSNEIHNSLTNGGDSVKVELPYSKKDIFDMVPDGYQALSRLYPELAYHPKSLKTSLYSTPLTYMGFSGYLNPFTIEAHVDRLIPIYKFPTTACHEAAHQIGFAAENEANFIGAIASINNPDDYFKYSGYTFALRYCLVELFKRNKDTYDVLLKSVNTGIIKNYKEVQEFWMSYTNPLEPVFEKTFDTFLKANNQSDGTKSYSYVVALLVNYYQEHPL